MKKHRGSPFPMVRARLCAMKGTGKDISQGPFLLSFREEHAGFENKLLSLGMWGGGEGQGGESTWETRTGMANLSSAAYLYSPIGGHLSSLSSLHSLVVSCMVWGFLSHLPFLQHRQGNLFMHL
jgi:hypothetical protein